MVDIFRAARRIQMKSHACSLVELARKLGLETEDLLRDANEGGLRIFARPDVTPTVVHINRNLLAAEKPYRVGRYYTPRPPFRAVSAGCGLDERAAGEPKKVSVHSVQTPDFLDQPISQSAVEGFYLDHVDCGELLSQGSAYLKTFDQVLMKYPGGWLQPISPLIGEGKFLNEELFPMPEWIFAAYGKTQEICFTSGIGYQSPDGFRVRIDHLFVSADDLERRYALIDTDASSYIDRYGGLEGFARSEDKHISKKLRLAAQVYLSCWYGKSFKTESEIKEVLNRFRKACEAICNPDLYHPNATGVLTDLPDLVENWLTPTEFRRTGVRQHCKVELIPWELQLLLASAELWEVAARKGGSVSRNQLIGFFREHGVPRSHATRLATVAGKESRPQIAIKSK